MRNLIISHGDFMNKHSTHTYHAEIKVNTAATGGDRTSPDVAQHFYLTFMSTDMIFSTVLCFDRLLHCCTLRTTICPRGGRKLRLGTSWDRYIRLQYRSQTCSTGEVSQRASLEKENYNSDLSFTCEEVLKL